MQIKPLSQESSDDIEVVKYTDDDLPIGSREALLNLVGGLLESDGDPRIRLFDRVPAMDLVGEVGGRAAYQLKSADIRFPLKNFLALPRRLARGAARAQILDAIAQADGWSKGEWRVVAVATTEAHKMAWTRRPSGLSESERDKLFDSPGQVEQNIQLRKPVQVRDPVLVVHLALAEVSQQSPKQGSRNKKMSAWDDYRMTAQLVQMPYEGRMSRERAIQIICDMHDIKPVDIVAELDDGQKERVLQMAEFGLTVSEIARALNVVVHQVEALVGAE